MHLNIINTCYHAVTSIKPAYAFSFKWYKNEIAICMILSVTRILLKIVWGCSISKKIKKKGLLLKKKLNTHIYRRCQFESCRSSRVLADKNLQQLTHYLDPASCCGSTHYFITVPCSDRGWREKSQRVHLHYYAWQCVALQQ